mmetsp:Transcript_14906/g.64517  ORF Transcript_14906/g.64517 Transcript_14906/m.64517 type:complete len:265 (-) Transcript_14906:855-1649(-)
MVYPRPELRSVRSPSRLARTSLSRSSPSGRPAPPQDTRTKSVSSPLGSALTYSSSSSKLLLDGASSSDIHSGPPPPPLVPAPADRLWFLASNRSPTRSMALRSTGATASTSASPPLLYARLNTSGLNCENGMRTICHFPVVANGAMNVRPSTPPSERTTEYRLPSPRSRSKTPSWSRRTTVPAASPLPRASHAHEICATPVLANTYPLNVGYEEDFESDSSDSLSKKMRCATSAAACQRPSSGFTSLVSSTVQSSKTSRNLAKL